MSALCHFQTWGTLRRLKSKVISARRFNFSATLSSGIAASYEVYGWRNAAGVFGACKVSISSRA
jgi:hypothetical protein